MVRKLIRGAAGQVAATVDRAFYVTTLAPPQSMRVRSSAESLEHSQRMVGLGAVEAFYSTPEAIASPAVFFGEPGPIVPERTRVRGYREGGEVVDLVWPSEFVPSWNVEVALQRAIDAGVALESDLRALLRRLDRSAPLVDKYLGARHNRIARARLFRHRDGPRPCVLLLHGYMTGPFLLEERIWPVQRLFDAGVDVLLGLLPFHGARRDARRGLAPPAFPSTDPRFTIEGFRQFVLDQRSLIAHLLASGAPSVGVMGMSLGGYGTALLATLEPRLAFALFYLPLASIDSIALETGRMTGDAEQRAQQAEGLRRAQWPVSPFARSSLVPPERILSIGGSADRVTGVAHSGRLAEHFGAEHVVLDGGHLLQLGRARAFEHALSLLGRTGMLG